MSDRSRSILFGGLSVAAAAGIGLVLLALAGANPFEAVRLIWEGSLGSARKIPDTLLVWVPVTLAAAGLVVTFAAGLWNIGIEGQVVMGAIAAAWVAREAPGPAAAVIPLTLLAGVIGGIIWGLLAGVLKVYGKVNEIFGGLGLDFVATGIATYLVIGPWKRSGVASTSGTDLFRPEVWLPETSITIGSTTASYSWLALLLAVGAVLGVYFLMRGTSYGLKLKAVGSNPRSAYLLGIPTGRFMLSAFALCGALAGLAGTVQATGFHHKLVPSVSGGYGFLAILVVLLAGFRAAWIAPIALFFMALSVGTNLLSIRMGLDPAIGGVLQGIVVLFTLLIGAWQVRRTRYRARTAGTSLVEEST